MGSIRTRLAENRDREALIDFIRDHWAARHVFVTAPEVFDWQYQQADGRINMMMAEEIGLDGQSIVLGVLGFIPMGRFDPSLGDADIMLALWKVRDDRAPPGLGLQLLKAVQRELRPRLIAAIGISEMVVPIYKALGYTLDHLLQAAIMNPACRGRARVAHGVPDEAYEDRLATDLSLRSLDLQTDGDLINELVRNQFPLKSRAYVYERFVNHPWYEYDCRFVLRHGRPETLLVWRAVEVRGVRVLRIVDMIGSAGWLSEGAALLRPMLAEADAEYIDIMGCGFSASDLQVGGFISPEWCDGLVLPNYFAPFEARNVKIGFSWKRMDSATGVGSVRLFRADSDQDRPNKPQRAR